ncbi:MAG: hypothetical protein AB9869_24190 [Verrucomicrobiia bacterium]
MPLIVAQDRPYLNSANAGNRPLERLAAERRLREAHQIQTGGNFGGAFQIAIDLLSHPIHRFRIEAAEAANSQHPNIVAVHEVGAFQGENHLVMDFVDGPSLAHNSLLALGPVRISLAST